MRSTLIQFQLTCAAFASHLIASRFGEYCAGNEMVIIAPGNGVVAGVFAGGAERQCGTTATLVGFRAAERAKVRIPLAQCGAFRIASSLSGLRHN